MITLEDILPPYHFRERFEFFCIIVNPLFYVVIHTLYKK
nr:MAG TPA: hypothetical protein [Caudoviricetes sp.]